MAQPADYTFSRYLASKKSVDDRALDYYVFTQLAGALINQDHAAPRRILEIGAGIGTMIERLLDWHAFSDETHLTAIEPDMDNVKAALDRLSQFAINRGFEQEPAGKMEVKLTIPGRSLLVDFQTVDLETFVRTHRGPGVFDLVIAHAVLDLLDVTEAIPAILSVSKNACLFYFTLNFDGATILQPEIEPALDRQIEELYHRTMDERVTNGKLSGDRYTGRHLFGHLRENGIQTLAAGSSDWVVAPGPAGYAQDEAYFLHFIIHTMDLALENHPELDRGRFKAWIAERHRQIEARELVYIAHQIDILGQR